MMDIPVNLLSVLKCFICEGYLSCGPIYIVENDKAACGRCGNKTTTNNEKPETTNHEAYRKRHIYYESLASLFQFPCRFAPFGCPEKILFSEEPSHPHDLSCKYEPKECPILSSDRCDWRGPWHHLLEHCEQDHPDNILENPYSSKPNFAEDSETSYIIPSFNTLFVLRINISFKAERAIYSVYLLDDPSKMLQYNFSVDCKRNNLTFSKRGVIGHADNFMKQKSQICIISKDVLFRKLSGVAGTTVVINIKQTSRTVKCKFCPIKVENYEGQEWICNNCEPNVQYCENKGNDCTFKDINLQKVKKHERYFCKYIKKCFDCNGAINAGKVFQHFDSSAHENTIYSKEGIAWIATETPKRTLNYVLLKSSNIDKLFCKYYLDGRQLSLILCSAYSSDQLNLYKCKIKVFDKEEKVSQKFEPNVEQDFFWDWRIDVDFDVDRYEPVKLDIKIDFERNNEFFIALELENNSVL